ncbi:proton-translocating transhydrogenase family protein [Candidatus Hepatobacter penaei]|uniref:proton-translocating transhydrogenase family protein n=1 Tax=Candidatus Hepatobacter penaei TaxID=1274402 RepID=UPI0004F38A47|nr:proton-translocating transhydrogenase family protein [Candidatus Hepatobacter penaei]
MSLLTVIFVLSIFLGFSIVTRVTPALHSPLMSLTNAVSSVIILGAFFALSLSYESLGWVYYLILGALFLCAVNIMGGFWMTYRMLGMFSRSGKKGA